MPNGAVSAGGGEIDNKAEPRGLGHLPEARPKKRLACMLRERYGVSRCLIATKIKE